MEDLLTRVWTDLKNWSRHAREVRAKVDNPDHSLVTATTAGIAATEQLCDELGTMTKTHLVIDLALLAQIRESKGWDAPSPENIDRKMLMAVGEVVEAQEHMRNGRRLDEIFFVHTAVVSPVLEGAPVPQPDGYPIEIADAVMRLLDIMYMNCGNVQRAFDLKMTYNAQRPMHHGGRKF